MLYCDYTVWKRPADGGAPFPVGKSAESLPGVYPDCAVCSVRWGETRRVESARWVLRDGQYLVEVRCHGAVEVVRLPRAALVGVRRVVVSPAFERAPSRRKKRRRCRLVSETVPMCWPT